MITQAQIQALSTKYQIDNFTIFREYLQLVFLSQLYRHNTSKHIYFKGGTAIRLLLASPRFSEDLDFSTTLTKLQIKQLMPKLETQLQIELPTLHLQTLYSGKTGLRYHLKYQSPTFKYPLNIRLDFTIVKKVLDPVVTPLITDFPISLFPLISHLSSQEILSEKICALTSRSKGRDYYDTYYLLAKDTPLSKSIFEAKLKENKLTLDPKLLIQKIETYSPTKISLDLAQFLPKSQKAIIPRLLSRLSLQLSLKLATLKSE